jgi:membrane protein YdbS with pleckstrin-like domain
MFKLEDVLQIKDSEDVKEIVRRHWTTLIPPLLLAFILIVIPFFLMFPLFAWGIPGVGLFLAAVLIGIVVAIRSFILWDADVLIVTSLRLVDVDQRGIFTRIVSEAPLASIQDVSWKRHGMFETIFRTGTIKVQTAGGQSVIEARKISGPEHLAEIVNDLRHRTAPKKMDIDPERHEKLKRISALLEGFSPEELTRIEAILRARERSTVTDAFLGTDEVPKT